MNARQMDAWIIGGGGQELLDEFYSNYNVYSFLGGNTGVQMGGWYRKQINTLEDIKGLKIRIAGIAGEIMSRMGAIPQQIAGSDIYPSLEKGTIDAAEWVAPTTTKLGFYKVAPNYYSPGWWGAGPGGALLCEQGRVGQAAQEYQAAFRAASREAHIQMTAMYDHKNPQALARLLAQGVKLQNFSNEIMKKAFDISRELYAEEAAKNPAWAKIYAEFEKYRKSQNAWFSVAEAGFDRFMPVGALTGVRRQGMKSRACPAFSWCVRSVPLSWRMRSAFGSPAGAARRRPAAAARGRVPAAAPAWRPRRRRTPARGRQ